MKKILIKSGEYHLTNTIVFPSLDVGLVGEDGTILVPVLNIIALQGVGDGDLLCPKCDYVLANKISRNQVQKLAIKCPLLRESPPVLNEPKIVTRLAT